MDAFEILVTRHRRPALRVAYAVAGGSDAEDAVQDAFVKAFRSLDRFRPGSTFRPWILRIVANEASNRRRSAGRRTRLALQVAGRAPTDRPSSPEEAVLADERRRVLAAALATLPERDRLVIACRWFAGLTEAEMAEVLDCRPGTVKSRLARALGRLRAELGASEVLR